MSLLLLFAGGGTATQQYFRPPTHSEGMAPWEKWADDLPQIPHRNKLMRHFVGVAVGVNVFKLVAGGYTEFQPFDMSTVAFTYYGSSVYAVDDVEAAALSAAGYASSLSTTPPS